MQCSHSTLREHYMTDQITEKSAILQRWYDEVWTKGRLEAIDEMFGESTLVTGIMPDFAVNPNDFKQLVIAIRALCKPPKATVIRSHEDGDWLSAMVQMQAVSMNTAEAISATGMVFARFEGGRMVETYNNFDFLTFFEKLGQLPEGTLGLLLAGERLS